MQNIKNAKHIPNAKTNNHYQTMKIQPKNNNTGFILAPRHPTRPPPPSPSPSALELELELVLNCLRCSAPKLLARVAPSYCTSSWFFGVFVNN